MTRTRKCQLVWWLVIGAQAVTASLFGLWILPQWGSDFGIYFVGGMSIGDGYGLYTGFFDHKGPLYYAFIRILSFFIPYSTIGAAIALGMTCAVWFASIGVGLRILQTSKLVQAIVGLCAIATLTTQTANASIALFGASFVFISLASMFKFSESGESIWCITSLVLLGFAVLTRIDALAMLPVILLIGIGSRYPNRRRVLNLAASLLGAVGLTFAFLLACSRWLGFSLTDYWAQGVLFNLTIYPEWYGTGSPSAHVLSAGYLGQSLMTSGLLSIWVLLLVLNWSQLPSRRRHVATMLVLYVSVVFVVTGSSKDYHLFIVYPGLLLSLAIVIAPVVGTWNKGIIAASIVAAVSSFLVVGTLLRDTSCVFEGVDNCPNPYQSLIEEVELIGVENNEFFGNDGWPYLLLDRKATVSFAPFFPLGVNLGEATRQALSDSARAREKVIWISDAQLTEAQTLQNNSVNEFLWGRRPLGEPILGLVPMSPVVSN